MLRKNDNLYDLSDGLEQYRGFVVSDINALENTVSFTNGVVLGAGRSHGRRERDRRCAASRSARRSRRTLRRSRRSSPKASRCSRCSSSTRWQSIAATTQAGEKAGEYAQIFEEEYDSQLNEVLTLEDTPYNRYLEGIAASRTHNGYFSIDKKTKRLVNPEVEARGDNAGEADDVDAYDLILRDKERLLTFCRAGPLPFLPLGAARRLGQFERLRDLHA